MARKGVQVQEVFEAADALLVAGVRPTVEQIRVKLGSGSPNTIAPMLDSWFKALGGRLLPPGAPKPEQTGPEVPDGVRQAVAALWSGAMTEAMKVAEDHMSEKRAALASRQDKLDEDRRTFDAQAQALEASRSALEQSIQLAQDQAADLRRQLTTAQALVDQRDGEISDLRDRLATIQQDLTAVHGRLQHAQDHARQQTAAHTEERREIEARATATQERLLGELTTARNQTEQALAAVEAAGTKLASLRQSMQLEIDRQTTKSADLQVALEREREAVANTRQLAGVLQAKFDAEVAKSSGLVDQLTEAREVSADLRRQLAVAVGNLKAAAPDVSAAARNTKR